MPEIAEFFPKTVLEREGATLEAALARLDQATASFAARLAAMPDGALHTSPAQGQWSPAEVADHLVKSNVGFGKVVRYARRRLADPALPPVTMARGQLTEDGRRIAPASVEPTPGRERADLLADLEASRARLAEEARALEVAGGLSGETHTHAFFGSMSGLECVQCAAWHTRHHDRRLAAKGEPAVNWSSGQGA